LVKNKATKNPQKTAF